MILAIVVFAILIIGLLLMQPQESEAGTKYKITFGDDYILKTISESETRHIEELQLFYSGEHEYVLFIVLPKNFNTDNISITKYVGTKIAVDEIEMYSFASEKEAGLDLKIESASSDSCTVNILVPETYVDSWTDVQKATFKQTCKDISQLELSCTQALEFESALAGDIYDLFGQDSS